ncbi:MAG: helix-turn-helix transcriptional regulator [Ruminococcaceae bacterium]|nr:helix-turn-helix transcriptional regulator [Oscillospiraceae bacterium]
MDRNICKFIDARAEDVLTVSCFVLESNQEIIRNTWTLKKHRMILVTQGDGEFLLESRTVPYSPGTLVFGFECESCRAQTQQETAYMYIDFSGVRSGELFRRFGITPQNRVFTGFAGLIPMWNESLASASGQNVDLAAESMLLYTFSRLSVKNPLQNDLLTRIVEISEENFSDPMLTITSVAQELSYNSKYLSHLFKQKMGMNYSDYIRTLRIKYAVALFERGIDSVKNVAFLSGFTDPLYFSSVFRKCIGVSPREFKKTLTDKESDNKKETDTYGDF